MGSHDRKEFSLVRLSRVPGPSQRYERAYAFSRSNLRITLPVDVIGISGMKAISRGYSCAESRVLTKVWISAASASEAAVPGLRTKKALTISVRIGSGLPTTAASATAG